MRILFFSFILCTFVSLVCAYFLQFTSVEQLKIYILSFDIFAVFIYSLLHIIFVLLLLPTAIMSIIAGIVFGPMLGVIIGLTSTNIGTSLTYIIGKTLAKSYILQKNNLAQQDILESINKLDWKFIVYVRFTSIIPVDFLNYAIGLTNMPLVKFLLVNSLCMLPSIIFYNYLGSYSISTNFFSLNQTALVTIAAFILFSALLASFYWYKNKYQR